MSTLGRLLRVAGPRADDISRPIAVENFTTEALAGAIRRHPTPFLKLLHAHSVATEVPADTPPSMVSTQVRLPDGDGVVIPDLVVSWLPAADLPTTSVLIEVKTGASLSGDDQLVRLRRAAGSNWAVLLSDVDHQARPEAVRWMTWQRVVDVVQAYPGVGDQWLDLAEFLKEIGMAGDAQFPIRAREAASLPDAHLLMLKALDVLTGVNQRLKTDGRAFPEFVWPDGHVRRTVRNQFESRGRLMLYGASEHPASVFYGIAPDRDGETRFVTWVSCNPARHDVRGRLVDWHRSRGAELEGFDVNVFPDYDLGWPLLIASESPSNLRTRELAIEWLVARIYQLLDAGFLGAMAQLLPDPTTTDVASDEDS